ncbi:MAG: amino acid adenylation domain-containing protein [Moorea sp. SIO1G6]|uniref:non-ribosomal peptide synthetase n=1 Tax=Moorena sp. SIO1G6 TaxID=2607840 RepID=UPI0013C0047C|nr:amino acid adenylation domain-containing protein [Moorena sp. SIO1G6]NET65458.1 amino acid adenylation domain-containing protein [Moorena sp. SIO1G6]
MVGSQKYQKKNNIESIYPLSPMQEGLLFHTLSDPNSGVYLEQILLTLSGQVNQETLKQSWQQVVQRHGVLRTMFVWEGRKQPLQVVRKQVDLPWSYLDWQDLSSTEQQQKLEEFLREDREKGFQLNQAPLMRCTLIRLGNQTCKLIWSVHHILVDGWCSPIIVKEVLSCYESYNQGKRCNLPPVPPYQDYILWLQQQNQEAAEEFWRQSLQGFTTPTPLVVERSQQQRRQHSSSYQEEQINLGQTTTKALQFLVREHRLTMATLLKAAWALLLSRYSGESEVLFGVGVSGRPGNLLGVEKMVGLFMNTLPLRVQVSSQVQLIPWLQQLNQKQLQLQEYSYSHLVEIQRLSEIPAGIPLFQSILVFENYPGISWEQWDSNLKIAKIDSFSQTNYPLSVITGVINEDLLLNISYDTSYFEADPIARMLGHLQTLLEAMVVKPNIKLGQLPLIKEAERDQILVEWNNTKTDYPKDKCIHQLFEEQVEKKPDAIAVVFEQQKLTYSQLNNKANQLAHYLQKLGVVPETLVGICVERSGEMVVGLLAILKAGGAYVPLDPNYPTSRLNYMVEDAQLSIILTQEKWQHHLSDTKASVICLDTDSEIINQQSQQMPENQVTANQLAYVIYTSGSTGQPKGVTIPHQGLLNLVFWHQRTFEVKSSDRVSQIAGVAFDASVEEIWPCLSAGACLHLVNSETILSPEALRDWLVSKKITISFVPTPLLENLCSLEWPLEAELRIVFTGGDKLRQYPSATLPFRVFNIYGPTENTVATTSGLVVSGQGGSITPPIGKPISNTKVYILDRNLQPVPIGVAGELHIGGDGLAIGYHNRPELTAEKFIVNPFDKSQATRLYKTGDLGRYLPDGNIEFIGRIDHQVKIRGYRIETGEIEATLTQHNTVKETVVLATEDNSGNKSIVAYIVLESETPEVSETEQIDKVKQYLKGQLPEYMIPSRFIPLSQLPLTPNGKVDRKALPAPDLAISASTEFVAPETETQKVLAEIWAEVLGIEQVGIHDNFFDLGGHSLKATQVVSRCRQAFGNELTLQRLLESPTIAGIAKNIEVLRQLPQDKTTLISETEEYERFVL